MQRFNDRLLATVDYLTGRLGPVNAILDSVMTRLVPNATALASYCPSYCGDTCDGVCDGGAQQYRSVICSYDMTGCDRGETWTNLIGCGC